MMILTVMLTAFVFGGIAYLGHNCGWVLGGPLLFLIAIPLFYRFYGVIGLVILFLIGGTCLTTVVYACKKIINKPSKNKNAIHDFEIIRSKKTLSNMSKREIKEYANKCKKNYEAYDERRTRLEDMNGNSRKIEAIRINAERYKEAWVSALNYIE